MAYALVTESQKGTHITGTTTLHTGVCGLLGIFVSSASGTPTITVNDGATLLVDTFTPVGPNFYPLPFVLSKSLIVTISGTVSCTVAWNSQ